MKAMMVVLVVGMSFPHEAKFDSMEECLKQAPLVQLQSGVEEAVCVPYTPRTMDLSNFQVMTDSFLTMIDQFRERSEAWGTILEDDRSKDLEKEPEG